MFSYLGKISCMIGDYSMRNILWIKNIIAALNLTTPIKCRIISCIEWVKISFYKKKIGKNTFIDKTVRVLGYKNFSIGSNSCIGEGGVINVNNRNAGGEEYIKIGNNCFIGKRNFFSQGAAIVVKDFCMTGMDCKFMSADHIFSDPLRPYISTGVTCDKTITIGVNVWIGAGVSVLGNVNVGHGSIIGAGSLVTKDIPPFCLAVGVPAKIIKYYNFEVNKWLDVNNDGFKSIIETPFLCEDYYLKYLDAHSDVSMPLQAAASNFGDIL